MAHYSDPNAPMSVSKADAIQPLAWSVLAAGVIALVFVGLFYWKTTSTEASTTEVNTAISEQERQLKDLQPTVDRLTQYDGTAQNLQALFKDQRRYEQVLSKIESSLYKRMRVTSLQISDKGVFTLTGVTPSYLDYAKVYTALTSTGSQQYFSTVKVVSVAKTDKKDAADITFTFQGTLAASALSSAAN